MSTYLVPTDFSDCATKATKVAMDLASKSNSDLHFLHVLSVPADWISLEDSAAIYPEVTKQVRQCQTHLDRLIKEAEGLGLKAFKHIAYNKNYQAILNHIKSHDISMGGDGFHWCYWSQRTADWIKYPEDRTTIFSTGIRG